MKKPSTTWRFWLFWVLAFFSFPIAGLLAVFVVPVDTPVRALINCWRNCRRRSWTHPVAYSEVTTDFAVHLVGRRHQHRYGCRAGNRHCLPGK